MLGIMYVVHEDILNSFKLQSGVESIFYGLADGHVDIYLYLS